jgi:hypothetical protein
MEKFTHENLVGTCWSSDKHSGQEHHVYFVRRGSLYLLANYETGVVEKDYTFEDFNELVDELKSDNWELLD